MARAYTKSKRAESQAETRLRIVEAAIGLHGSVGPAATTIGMIAERAEVQRHTVYAHFPDERSLLMACSSHHLEQEPPPAPAAWNAIEDPAVRLTTALAALYDWFARNQQMVGNVLRDAEQNAVLREVSDLRFGAAFTAIYNSLATGLGKRGQAALGLAISFHTWRTLVREMKLKQKDAVALMTRSILGAESIE
jgi:AcrR family transcriptional regulator